MEIDLLWEISDFLLMKKKRSFYNFLTNYLNLKAMPRYSNYAPATACFELQKLFSASFQSCRAVLGASEQEAFQQQHMHNSRPPAQLLYSMDITPATTAFFFLLTLITGVACSLHGIADMWQV